METRPSFSFCELIDLSSSIHEFPAQFSSIPVSVVSLQPTLSSADTFHSCLVVRSAIAVIFLL